MDRTPRDARGEPPTRSCTFSQTAARGNAHGMPGPDNFPPQTCPGAHTPDCRGRTVRGLQGARQKRWTAGPEQRVPRCWRPSETHAGHGPLSSASASRSPQGDNAHVAGQDGQRKWDTTSDAPCWQPMMHHHAPQTATDADRTGAATPPATRSARPGGARSGAAKATAKAAVRTSTTPA